MTNTNTLEPRGSWYHSDSETLKQPDTRAEERAPQNWIQGIEIPPSSAGQGWELLLEKWGHPELSSEFQSGEKGVCGGDVSIWPLTKSDPEQRLKEKNFEKVPLPSL